MKKTGVFLSCFLLFFLLSSCAFLGKKEDRLILEKTSYSTLKDWNYNDKKQSFEAFKQSCPAFAKQPPNNQLRIGQFATKISHWQDLCRKADNVNSTDKLAVHRFFEKEFEPYLVTNNGKKTGLFTGYYEPLLKGSRRRYGPYHHPVYRLPPDVIAGKPYYSRREINQGVLAGRGLEIAYVNDPVQEFFLQIQGSGRIQLDDGSILRVGYAGKNNREYVAIGKYLKEKGFIAPENMSAQSIKQWLYTNKDKANAVMEMNPSYVFFRELTNQGGPIGGQGVPLTASASLAVDKQFIPYGVPLWLETTLPDGSDFKRLMVAQDTGGAIKGPVRGDIFFGFGADAEHHAGLMKNQGSYVALLPKDAGVFIVSRN